MRKRPHGAWVALLAPVLAVGCVTVAEFRKLEREVHHLRGGDVGSQLREQQAELSTRIDELGRELDGLRGQIEVVSHQASQALDEVRAVRRDAAAGAPAEAPSASALADPPPAAAEGGSPEGQGLSTAIEPSPGAAPPGTGSSAAEVSSYRDAYAAWRGGDTQLCIERFRVFLQAFGSSSYADDAAYWLADCYFKQGDYKTAILRFDDVVARYPTGNKAADALYRQGEALLRLGPGYQKAASRAFERVLNEYPDSGRSAEAKRQLSLLGAG